MFKNVSGLPPASVNASFFKDSVGFQCFLFIEVKRCQLIFVRGHVRRASSCWLATKWQEPILLVLNTMVDHSSYAMD